MYELEPAPRKSIPDVRHGAAPDAAPVLIEIPRSSMRHDYGGLLEYWQMIRRHRGAVILAAFVGGLLGFLVTVPSPRIYQAKTTLEVRGLNEEFLNMRNVNPVSESSPYFDTDIQTQVKILQSRTLVDGVAKKLENRPHPQDLVSSDRLGMWRQALGISPPDAAVLWRQAVMTAAGSLRVRSFGTNRIVEVSCDSTHPLLAAEFCNTLVQDYIDQSLEARWKSTEYTGQWLSQQLHDLKVKLEQQEEELQTYARATGLVMTGDGNDARETQLNDLQRELSAARGDRIGKQSKYEMASSSPPEALPDVLDDTSLRESYRSLADLEARLANLRTTFTSNHPEVKRVEAQVASMEKSLARVRANILRRIRNEYAAAQRRENLLETAYQAQARLVSSKAEETAKYTLLRREVEATRTLYDTLQQRLKEASIAAALRASNIRVVDAAEAPAGPYKPNVARFSFLGLLFGLFGGVAFAVFRERADRTLQDPGDITYYLGLNELGVLPPAEALEVRRPTRVGAPAALAPRHSSSNGQALEHRVELTSWQQKSSLLAESIRTTLTSILFSQRDGARPRVIVLTSAGPHEGKTTVVTNLAIALAEINQRVLVIDADMRRPRLHTILHVENEVGLSNLLLEKRPLDAATLVSAGVPTAVPGLYLLPSGNCRSHASTLLHAERLPEVVRLARECFDAVIIDTPPMINIADARVIARHADGLVLVVRSGVTTRDAALLAKTRFVDDGVPIVGTILNFWNPKTPGYSYYKYYYAGYYHYYGNGNGHGGDSAGAGMPGADDVAADGLAGTRRVRSATGSTRGRVRRKAPLRYGHVS